MPNNQPINLKERMKAKELPKPEAVLNLEKPTDQKKVEAKEEKSKTIEAFFGGEIKEEAKDYFSFEKAIGKIKFDWLKKYKNYFYIGLAAIFLIIVSLVVIKLIGHRTSVVTTKEWYAVKLINNEVYYGQIGNIKSDPLVIENVYYNYDSNDPQDQSNNLRLVKRGKESYGPSGVMNIVRSQVLFIEPLKQDSKVLQAIREYEK